MGDNLERLPKPGFFRGAPHSPVGEARATNGETLMAEREDIAALQIGAATCRTHWVHQHKLDGERDEWECRMDKRVRFLETRGAKWSGAAMVIGGILTLIGGAVATALMR